MRICLEDTFLLVVDVQERLTPHITNAEQVISRIKRVISGVQALHLPIIVNEQYRKGLGETVAELQAILAKAPHYEKVTFSACDDDKTRQAMEATGRKNVVICGIETHVCILQSALDLLTLGYQPIIVCDAVGSRFTSDHDSALARLSQAGAILTSSESILFELCRSSKAEAFKTISQLVK